MTDRVMLGALGGGDFGLRVSRPGYDVTDTTLSREQLAFDSRWAEVSNVFMAGSGITSSSETTISFGTTFSSPPLCIVMAKFEISHNSIDDRTAWRLISNMDCTAPDAFYFVKSTTTSLQFSCPSGKPYNYIVLRNVYE